MNFKLLSAHVLRYGTGPDRCTIELDLPSAQAGIWGEKLNLSFNARRRTGFDYIRTHFGLEASVTEVPPNQMKFSR